MSGIITLLLGIAFAVSALTWQFARRRVTRAVALLTVAGILGYFLNQLGEHFPRGG
jgi:hypothetical protein